MEHGAGREPGLLTPPEDRRFAALFELLKSERVMTQLCCHESTKPAVYGTG